jgi:hypothetical protein
MKGRKFELADESLGRRTKEEKTAMVYKHWDEYQAEKIKERELALEKNRGNIQKKNH